MTQIDYDRELALVTIPEQRPGELVAIATLISDPDGREAEFAVLVYHGVGRSGVGYHLMDCLLQHARRRGIARVYGDVLRENAGMRGLARSLGFREHAHPHDASCVEVDIDPASRK
jgi:N-acetylglutamate synthase-like GNAT family acetyltransferase